jgi:hypothetical protein
MTQGAWLLTCYGLASLVILAILGAATTGIHMFARTAAGLVLIGLVLLGVVGAVNRRTRQALLAARPELADVVRPSRYPPGNGMAVFVYVPFLVLVVCLGITIRAAAHPPPRTAVTTALVSGCRQQPGTVACQGSWTVSGRFYAGTVDLASAPGLGIGEAQLRYNVSDPQVVYDAAHPVPSGGVFDFVVATVFFALFSARAEVVYDRSCRAPYRGFLMHAAQAETQYGLTAPA